MSLNGESSVKLRAYNESTEKTTEVWAYFVLFWKIKWRMFWTSDILKVSKTNMAVFGGQRGEVPNSRGNIWQRRAFVALVWSPFVVDIVLDQVVYGHLITSAFDLEQN